MLNKILQIEKWLSEKNEANSYKVCVGFDGFVDSIEKPVLGYTVDGDYEFFPTMAQFGAYLQEKAGKSCSIELKKELEKSGGNAFIFANALVNLGFHADCIGAFGHPEVHEVFQHANERMNLISVAKNGVCSALEFEDGKIMLADNTGIDAMNFQVLKESIGEHQLCQFINGADVVSFMNWSELKNGSDIWKGFLSEVFPKINNKKIMFLDVSDCSSRDKRDISEMLTLMCSFAKYFDLILSLNANEFQIIGDLLAETERGKTEADCMTEKDKARLLYEYCSLSKLFIHKRECAIGFSKDEECCVNTRFVEKPRFSTGGGDNFNAGLMYGIVHQFDLEACMILGNCASGYYITRGASPSEQQLLFYLKEWERELYNESSVCENLQVVDMWKITPAVFAVGNEYQIMIPAECESIMWVEVEGKCYYDASNGIMRSNTLVHKAIVPMAELDRVKKYRVYLQRVLDRKPYFTETAIEEVREFDFKPVQGDSIRAYHLADTHNAVEEPVIAAKTYGPIDFLILNGDIPDHSGKEKNILTIYELIARITQGTIPVVFSRGNHDMRGKYAEKFAEYTPGDHGNSYYTFRLGDIWGLVLDDGEDKIDAHLQYANMMCCRDFRKRETEYIKEVIQNAKTEYEAEGINHKIIISHATFTHQEEESLFNIEHDIHAEWVALLREYIKPEMILCGHVHELGVYECGGPKDSHGQPCPVISGSGRYSGPEEYVAGAGIEFSPKGIEIRFTDCHEKVLDTFWV